MEQQDLELFNKKYERVFHQLYEKTFSFLDSQSLVNSLTVSKDFYHLLNQYFKNFLATNNLIDASDIPLPGSVDEDHYLKLFRSFYTREVLVGHLSNVKQSYSELQLVRYPRCSTYGVKDFSLGSKFAVFHLFNNDIIFLKSEEYLNPLFNMKNINTKNIRKNVTKFSTNAKDLFYMNTAGHLHTIFYNPDLASHELSEGVLDLTISHPLKDFDVSYIHGILLLKGPEQKGQKKIEEQKEDNKKRVIQDIRHFNIHNLTPEEYNAPQKICKVDGLDDQDVSSMLVGNNVAYFIADNSKIFECDFAEINNEKYMITSYEHLKNKMIRKIWGGYNHFFALEQNEIGSIDTWTQAEILQWANSKDFEEFRNIIKYENISGKDLLKADKTFLVERLGMMREDLQIKFLNDIQKVAKKTYKKPKIYAWGNNSFGQLGINTGHVNVNFPHEVTIPELVREDSIVDIKCGWKQSVILTHKGHVYVTEMLVKKAQKEKEKEKEEEEEAKPAKGDKGKKGKKKESVDVQEDKKATEKPLTKWFDLTPTCETLKDGRQYRVMQVSLNKENIAVLGAYLGSKKKKGEEDEEKAGSKFKGSDHIYHRILWDKKLKKEEFAVGYEDRFLGILEIPFEEFNLKTDIPMHRIKYFKQNGEIVWDRVQKVNKL